MYYFINLLIFIRFNYLLIFINIILLILIKNNFIGILVSHHWINKWCLLPKRNHNWAVKWFASVRQTSLSSTEINLWRSSLNTGLVDINLCIDPNDEVLPAPVHCFPYSTLFLWQSPLYAPPPDTSSSLLPYFHFVLNYFLYSSLFQLGKKITWLIQIQCFHSLGTEWGKIYCPISKPMSYTNHYFLYLIFQYFHNGFPQHGAILFLQHWDEQDKHLAHNLLFRGNGLSKKYPQSCRETRNQCICWLYISQSFHSSSNNSNLAFLGAT